MSRCLCWGTELLPPADSDSCCGAAAEPELLPCLARCCGAAAEVLPVCLFVQAFPKNFIKFFNSPSYRIFRRMHKVLNIDENKN